MDWLNYNHFFYFWIIAQEMNVTRAAKRLRVSQSSLSEQLKIFESTMGTPLFERKGRTLLLTEAGRLALNYGNVAFGSAQEMIADFKGRPHPKRRTLLRVGAISSLSKNLQYEFIRPMIAEADTKLVMLEGNLSELIHQLKNHALDLVISNVPARADTNPEIYNHRLKQIKVSLVGHPMLRRGTAPLAQWLEKTPLFLPTRTGRFRSDFDAWVEREKLTLEVKAEIEDMALLRLFALSGKGVALVPEIVVQRELARKELVVLQPMKGLTESFFALTTSRRFPNAKVERLVKHFGPQ